VPKKQGYYVLIQIKKGGKQMTKAELIEQMAMDAKISKAAAGVVLDSFMTNVTNALKKKDGKVTLVGFGTFAKVRRKARKGRNPQTGEPLKIKARNAVTFKAGKKLKDAI
jgi:DNA-binding protein HU-beta